MYIYIQRPDYLNLKSKTKIMNPIKNCKELY